MKNWFWFHDFFSSSEIHLHGYDRLISSLETKYQKIDILTSPLFGKMLVIDGDVQSSELDEYIYHESLVLPSMISHPNPKRIFLAGGGEGATLREIVKNKTVEHVIKCDIDEKAIQLFIKMLPEWHQNSFFDPRVTLVHEDARNYLEQQKDSGFDVIITDLTEPTDGGPSQKLFSEEFFKICYRKLTTEGVICLQASLLRITNYEMHSAILHTIERIFPIVKSMMVYVPSFDTTWGFIFASKKIDPTKIDPKSIDERIKERLTSSPKFYDSIAHQMIFSITKDMQNLLFSNQNIISDSEPFSLKKKSEII